MLIPLMIPKYTPQPIQGEVSEDTLQCIASSELISSKTLLLIKFNEFLQWYPSHSQCIGSVIIFLLHPVGAGVHLIFI